MRPATLPLLASRGSLDEHSLPVLLTQLLGQSFSGMLHLESGESKTWIFLERGFPTAAHIPNSEVYLGMVLRELGFIDDQAFNESLLIMSKTNKLRGQVLMEMGKISQDQLSLALAVQLKRKLVQLFALTKGSFALAAGEPLPKNIIPIRVHPFPVIFNGVKNCYQPAEIRDLLNRLLAGKACRVSPRFYVEYLGVLDLPLEEQEEVDRLRQVLLPADFVKNSRVGSTSAMMLLLALFYCELLELIDVEQDKSAASQVVFPAAEGLPTSSTTEKTSAPSAKENEKPKTQIPPELPRMLKEKIEEIKRGDLFAMLGVSREATDEQVKKAFWVLSKVFHPDRLAQIDDEDLKNCMSFAFSKINEAYVTLSDPKSRQAHHLSLSNRPGQKRKVDPDAALVEYEKAKVFINKKNNHEALAHLQLAHELDPSKAEYQARLIWYEYLCSEQPKPVKQEKTKQSLTKMFKEVPGNFYVNRHLASLLREMNDEAGYEAHLRKANNIRATDIETAREMRLLGMRKGK